VCRVPVIEREFVGLELDTSNAKMICERSANQEPIGALATSKAA
jgi:hypothetical protein